MTTQEEEGYKEAIVQMKKIIQRLMGENSHLNGMSILSRQEAIDIELLTKRIQGLQELNHSMIVHSAEQQNVIDRLETTNQWYQKWFDDHRHLIKTDHREIKTARDLLRDHNMHEIPVDNAHLTPMK